MGLLLGLTLCGISMEGGGGRPPTFNKGLSRGLLLVYVEQCDLSWVWENLGAHGNFKMK